MGNSGLFANSNTSLGKKSLNSLNPEKNQINKKKILPTEYEDSPDHHAKPRRSEYVKKIGMFENNNSKKSNFSTPKNSNMEEMRKLFEHHPEMLEPVNLDQIKSLPTNSKRNILLKKKSPSSGIDDGVESGRNGQIISSLNTSARRSAQRSRSKKSTRPGNDSKPTKVFYHPSEAELPAMNPSKPIKSARSRSKKDQIRANRNFNLETQTLRNQRPKPQARFSNSLSKMDFQNLKLNKKKQSIQRGGNKVLPSKPLNQNNIYNNSLQNQHNTANQFQNQHERITSNQIQTGNHSKNLSPNDFNINRPITKTQNNRSNSKLSANFSNRQHFHSRNNSQKYDHNSTNPQTPINSNPKQNQKNPQTRQIHRSNKHHLPPSRPVPKGRGSQISNPSTQSNTNQPRAQYFTNQPPKNYLNPNNHFTHQPNRIITPRNKPYPNKRNTNIYSHSRKTSKTQGSGGMSGNFGPRVRRMQKQPNQFMPVRNVSIDSRSKAKSRNLDGYPFNSTMSRTQTAQNFSGVMRKKKMGLSKANSRSMSNLHEKNPHFGKFMTNSHKKMNDEPEFRVDKDAIKRDFEKMNF